jgi:hypothetical protein
LLDSLSNNEESRRLIRMTRDEARDFVTLCGIIAGPTLKQHFKWDLFSRYVLDLIIQQLLCINALAVCACVAMNLDFPDSSSSCTLSVELHRGFGCVTTRRGAKNRSAKTSISGLIKFMQRCPNVSTQPPISTQILNS